MATIKIKGLKCHETEDNGQDENLRKGMIKIKYKIVTFILLCIFASSNLFAEETLNVEDSEDVRSVSEIQMNIFVGLMMHCMQELSQKMKEKGATDKEIEDFFSDAQSDETKSDELQRKCLCMNKDIVMERFSKLDAILLKHPEWKGKTLVIKGVNGGTEKLSIEILEEAKEVVLNCP